MTILDWTEFKQYLDATHTDIKTVRDLEQQWVAGTGDNVVDGQITWTFSDGSSYTTLTLPSMLERGGQQFSATAFENITKGRAVVLDSDGKWTNVREAVLGTADDHDTTGLSNNTYAVVAVGDRVVTFYIDSNNLYYKLYSYNTTTALLTELVAETALITGNCNFIYDSGYFSNADDDNTIALLMNMTDGSDQDLDLKHFELTSSDTVTHTSSIDATILEGQTSDVLDTARFAYNTDDNKVFIAFTYFDDSVTKNKLSGCEVSNFGNESTESVGTVYDYVEQTYTANDELYLGNICYIDDDYVACSYSTRNDDTTDNIHNSYMSTLTIGAATIVDSLVLEEYVASGAGGGTADTYYDGLAIDMTMAGNELWAVMKYRSGTNAARYGNVYFSKFIFVDSALTFQKSTENGILSYIEDPANTKYLYVDAKIEDENDAFSLIYGGSTGWTSTYQVGTYYAKYDIVDGGISPSSSFADTTTTNLQTTAGIKIFIDQNYNACVMNDDSVFVIITDNRNDVLGISSDSYGTGSAAIVDLKGGITTSLTGLTPARTYYVQSNGTVSTTRSSYPIGIALSSTQLKLF